MDRNGNLAGGKKKRVYGKTDGQAPGSITAGVASNKKRGGPWQEREAETETSRRRKRQPN